MGNIISLCLGFQYSKILYHIQLQLLTSFINLVKEYGVLNAIVPCHFVTNSNFMKNAILCRLVYLGQNISFGHKVPYIPVFGIVHRVSQPLFL